ncbi:MAG: hypothetical protein ACPGCN_16150, partial [bacterium]
MYTKQALREIGIQTELAPTYREQLDQDGFFLVKNYFDEEACDRMAAEFDRLTALEGNQGGHEVHIEPKASRISDIFNKTTEFDRCLSIEHLLQASHHLLGEFKVHGANLREPLHNGGHQKLHTDVPKKFGDDWWVSNSIIALDDIT